MEEVLIKQIIDMLIEDSVKFDRMPNLPESPFPECNIEKGCPPLGMYRPNYTSIYNESPITYIKRHPVINPHSKIKKIMYQYRVPMEYQIIHKLNNQTSY